MCVYVLLSTCYELGIIPDTRKIVMNSNFCPLRAFILFSKKLLRCRINIQTSARESLRCLQFSSAAQSCLTLCDSIDCSTPGLLVHHQLLEFIQTHVH